MIVRQLVTIVAGIAKDDPGNAERETEAGRDLGRRLRRGEQPEDLATLHALTRRGCDLVQGYFVARPLAVAELRRWLAAWPGSPWTGTARPAVVVPELPALSV